MIKPIYESMAKDHPELSFGKVDIDDNAEAAAKYEVRNNPPLIIFSRKQVINSSEDSHSFTSTCISDIWGTDIYSDWQGENFQ